MAPLDAERLVAFAAVARQGGFSRAARALGKTQSAVSQAVILLERELGAALFVRDGRTTRLTDAGARLLQHADRVFSEMDAARESISALGELKTGSLGIGASDTLSCHLLPPVFRTFRARYPGVDLRLENRPSPETLRAVAERRVDVGVVVLPQTESGDGFDAGADRVSVIPLVPHVDKAICPPVHPLARRSRVRPSDLGDEPLLLLDKTTGTRAYVDVAFDRAGVRPRVAMEMGSVEVLKRLVELGFGVSIVPAMAIVREVEGGTLRALDFASGIARRQIALVVPAGAALRRAAAAFVETATAELER